MNLAEGHFLKLKISLQATAKAAELPDGSKALDIAIDQFSNRSVISHFTENPRVPTVRSVDIMSCRPIQAWQFDSRVGIGRISIIQIYCDVCNLLGLELLRSLNPSNVFHFPHLSTNRI